MQYILLASLLTATAFVNFFSLPAVALGNRTCQERWQTLNKTEDAKAHRQRHRQQILNKQIEPLELIHQPEQWQVANKHLCS